MLQEKQFLGEFPFPHYTITKTYIDTETPQIRLFHTRFTPPNPKRTICIVHGFGQHSSRFHHIADYYAKNSFEVLLVDLRGFGYSGGARASATILDLENDVIHLLKTARQDIPLFLYGHSLGGLVVIKLLLECSQLNVSGCIITSPFLGLGKGMDMPWWKLQLVKIMGDALSDFVGNSKVNPTALTKDTKYYHKMFSDQLTVPFLGANMAKSAFQSLEYVNQNMNNFHYPILILHGEEDTVTSCEGSKHFIFSKMRPFKELKLFDHGYHELQHDVEKGELLEKSLDFIGRITNQKAFGQMRREPIPKPIKRTKYRWIVLFLVIVLIGIRKYWSKKG